MGATKTTSRKATSGSASEKAARRAGRSARRTAMKMLMRSMSTAVMASCPQQAAFGDAAFERDILARREMPCLPRRNTGGEQLAAERFDRQPHMVAEEEDVARLARKAVEAGMALPFGERKAFRPHRDAHLAGRVGNIGAGGLQHRAVGHADHGESAFPPGRRTGQRVVFAD